PATPARSTPSLHDALPIYLPGWCRRLEAHARHGVDRRYDGKAALQFLEMRHTRRCHCERVAAKRRTKCREAISAEPGWRALESEDRKSTRLNSSHVKISYA